MRWPLVARKAYVRLMARWFSMTDASKDRRLRFLDRRLESIQDRISHMMGNLSLGVVGGATPKDYSEYRDVIKMFENDIVNIPYPDYWFDGETPDEFGSRLDRGGLNDHIQVVRDYIAVELEMDEIEARAEEKAVATVDGITEMMEKVLKELGQVQTDVAAIYGRLGQLEKKVELLKPDYIDPSFQDENK